MFKFQELLAVVRFPEHEAEGPYHLEEWDRLRPCEDVELHLTEEQSFWLQKEMFEEDPEEEENV